MSDLALRNRLVRVAASLPKGSAERRTLVAFLAANQPTHDAGLSRILRLAASKMPEVTVQGFEGFTDQIRQLSELSTAAEELQARIDAAVAPLLAEKAGLDKDIKKVHEEIKGAYKENLTAIGNVTIERKTALVTASAMLKVTARKATLDSVQAELLSQVAQKYGDEVAEFIKATQEALREANKTMAIAFQGFDLEARLAKTASTKSAGGLVEALTKFKTYLMSKWQSLVATIQTAFTVVDSKADKVERTHKELMAAIDKVS